MVNWIMPEKNTYSKLWSCRLVKTSNIPFCGRIPLIDNMNMTWEAMFARKFNGNRNILDVIDHKIKIFLHQDQMFIIGLLWGFD